MKNMNEKRNVLVKPDKTKQVVKITYESSVEMDLENVGIKIKQLKAQIAQMKYHHNRLSLDIQSAEKELEELQSLKIDQVDDFSL